MKQVPLKEIKPNPNNPRVIKDDKFAKLVQSLKDLPEMASVRPIVVNQDMIVLGGNMRLKAMKEAGCHPYRNRIQVGGRMQFVVMNRSLARNVEGLDDEEARKVIREAMKQPNQVVGDNI